MAQMERTTAGQSPLVVGRVATNPTRIPSELLELAYVFSGHDRIIGFFGRLHVSPAGDFVLEDFLTCCTRQRSVPGDTEATLLERCLQECGWIPGQEHGQSFWQSGGYRMLFSEDAATPDDPSFHIVLYSGNGIGYLEQHLSKHVPRHRRFLNRPARPRTYACDRPSQGPEEAARLLCGKNLTVYTGAGISAASSIPTFFGKGSLDERLALQEPFPGEIVAWMCAKPEALACEVGSFQARLLSAAPNQAHLLLAQLESAGRVREIITANLDMLHERGGSKVIVTPRAFAVRPAQAGSEDKHALLVIGVSEDSDGAIARARQDGWPVFVADIQPPEYLTYADHYIQADAECVLAALAQPCALAPMKTANGNVTSPTNTMWLAIPNFRRLLDEVDRRTTSGDSDLHGRRHWQETAWFGLDLLSEVSDGDSAVVLLFALLHDCCRLHDGDDPDHGRRAAQLVAELQGELLHLNAEQKSALQKACALHADGLLTEEATVAACWDADRLGLWRVGVRPDPARLCLTRSRKTRRILEARYVFARRLDWEELFAAYARL